MIALVVHLVILEGLTSAEDTHLKTCNEVFRKKSTKACPIQNEASKKGVMKLTWLAGKFQKLNKEVLFLVHRNAK